MCTFVFSWCKPQSVTQRIIHFLMILSANWAYLKDASHMHAYQDIKMKEEQELHDITSRSKECLNSYT
ncbi:unnamed protein product [Oncorhynchus mykiss]|uniref:Uncharacterized protein n=1 Tax=Oncorhynchus mykiss TaxID=8022 RepID=A0A060VXD7_ONCMY|nr:unnamed protein product [Oncorhynchus mykiss]